MSPDAKRPPRLELSIEIEGNCARVRIAAESAEDEIALRRWLRRRPRVLASLADVEHLLDALDRRAA